MDLPFSLALESLLFLVNTQQLDAVDVVQFSHFVDFTNYPLSVCLRVSPNQWITLWIKISFLDWKRGKSWVKFEGASSPAYAPHSIKLRARFGTNISIIISN